jgi:serine/threonine protein kinase
MTGTRISLLNSEDVFVHTSALSYGTFGVVHEGTYRDKPVAVKKLLPSRNSSDETSMSKTKENFEKEADLVFSLNHDNIVKVIMACNRPSRGLAVLPVTQISV